jgi:peptide/nickel transport system substrate-binding protein
MRGSDGGTTRAWPASRSVALAAAALAAAAVLLAGAGPAAASSSASPVSPASPGASAPPGAVDYRIGISQKCDGVNPFSSWSAVSWECFRLGYDFLTWYDADYRPAPDIAAGWETSEDGLTWTFRIREGMKWQDGVPLTAADVAFTYNLILDTRQPAYVQYLTGVTSVTAPDDATLVITTRKPSTGMLALAIPILPEHIWAKVDPDRLGEFANLPFVGSGPFRVASLEQGGRVRLEAVPGYPAALGGAPGLDSVTFVAGDDADTLADLYRSGELDAVVDFPATYEQLYAGMTGTSTVASPAIGFHELGFNCWQSPRSKGNPMLRDPSIRRAVHWAIDKRQIAATAMAGLAEPATSLLSPAQAEWRWDVPADAQYSYDPQRAKQILDDAGYADRDADGVREDAAGNELSFRLAALDEYPEDLTAARMIAGWCRDVGIRLRLERTDERAFSDAIFNDADYDLFVWSWGGDVDPGVILSTFTTSQIMGWSDSQYSNPDYDRLFVRQAQALDPASPDDITRRKTYTDAMQKILYRDDPYVVLWYNVNLQAYRTDRWTGYALAPSGDGAPFWNQLRATYVALRPLRPAALPAAESSREWLWALAVAVVAAGAVALALLRRRRKATEDE